MIKEMEYSQDDRTVILNRSGEMPAQTPLTDFAAAPRMEKIEQRMVYAARRRDTSTFNPSLNPLISLAATCYPKWFA